MDKEETSRKNGTLFQAGQNSWDGLAVLLRERAAKRELLLIVVSLLCYALYPQGSGLLLVVLSFLLLAVEAVNTAIETICDHITPERHPMIKRAKDLGSAAILIAAVAWGVTLLHAVWSWVHA